MKKIDKILIVLGVLFFTSFFWFYPFIMTINDIRNAVLPYPEKYAGAVYESVSPPIHVQVDSELLKGTMEFGGETIDIYITHTGRGKEYAFIESSEDQHLLFTMNLKKVTRKKAVLEIEKDNVKGEYIFDNRFEGLNSEIVLERIE